MDLTLVLKDRDKDRLFRSEFTNAWRRSLFTCIVCRDETNDSMVVGKNTSKVLNPELFLCLECNQKLINSGRNRGIDLYRNKVDSWEVLPEKAIKFKDFNLIGDHSFCDSLRAVQQLIRKERAVDLHFELWTPKLAGRREPITT